MPLPDFISMEHVYHTDRHELNLTRITFWVYLISVPVMLFVVAVPYIQGRPFQFTPFLLIFVGIAGFLLFQTVRILRIILAMKAVSCTVTDETVSGISIPDPKKPRETFSIRRDEILGIGKRNFSVSTMRPVRALMLNTKTHSYVLLNIERMDELKKELESGMEDQPKF